MFWFSRRKSYIIEQAESFSCHSREGGCGAIANPANIRIFVIPGLTRGSTGSPPWARLKGNPDFFQNFTLLDAGSSPAWRSEISRLVELRHRLEGGNHKRGLKKLPQWILPFSSFLIQHSTLDVRCSMFILSAFDVHLLWWKSQDDQSCFPITW